MCYSVCDGAIDGEEVVLSEICKGRCDVGAKWVARVSGAQET